MVRGPGDYPWSSHQANAHGREDKLTQAHEVYLALGGDEGERQRAYQGMFRREANAEEVERLRTGINLCVPVGNDRFKAEIERRLQQRISYKARGRPRRRAAIAISEET